MMLGNKVWNGCLWFLTGIIMTAAFIGYAIQPYLDAFFGIKTKN